MDYIYADLLSPDQLEIGDFIEGTDGYDSYIVQVIGIFEEDNNTWKIKGRDEYGDSQEFYFADDAKIKLFVFR